MKKFSFNRIFKGCCIAFLLCFVFLTQMFYSNGLYKSAIWIDSLYREHVKEPVSSITLSMTPSVIENGLAPIFPYTFYHLTHYWFSAADIPVA
ncbi:MAG: hypothetical protein RSC68_22705, partial [Acinetobacter sp.]